MPKAPKFKLDVKRDVQAVSDNFGTTYMLYLPYGWRILEDGDHVTGWLYSMKEVREFVRDNVRPCYCDECTEALSKQ